MTQSVKCITIYLNTSTLLLSISLSKPETDLPVTSVILVVLTSIKIIMIKKDQIGILRRQLRKFQRVAILLYVADITKVLVLK